MNFFLKISKGLGLICILSFVAFLSLFNSEKSNVAFVMLSISVTAVCTWVLCFFSRESGKELSTSPFNLTLDHPYEILAQWTYDGNLYAVFKPLATLNEKQISEGYYQRFINLGCALILPSRFVIPTIEGGAFTFKEYPGPIHIDAGVNFESVGKLRKTSAS